MPENEKESKDKRETKDRRKDMKRHTILIIFFKIVLESKG